jgi:hypothetical protein
LLLVATPQACVGAHHVIRHNAELLAGIAVEQFNLAPVRRIDLPLMPLAGLSRGSLCICFVAAAGRAVAPSAAATRADADVTIVGHARITSLRFYRGPRNARIASLTSSAKDSDLLSSSPLPTYHVEQEADGVREPSI